MDEELTNLLAPEVSAAKIFECCGARLEPEAAAELWPRILQHKWLMSEKLGRDVGLRVACIDFLENMEQAREEYLAYQQQDLLKEMGALTISKEIWDTIADSQPPKQIVQKRIILPLTQENLSKKHGVVPPKAIIFFGPPGTGKTHFAKAIAGALSWWFIEIAPSMLMVDGVEKVGANLRQVMEKARTLKETVIFIDEFEELREIVTRPAGWTSPSPTNFSNRCPAKSQEHISDLRRAGKNATGPGEALNHGRRIDRSLSTGSIRL